MYLFDFVNAVRGAQGYEPLERMPLSSDPRTSLELAMGCRLERGRMRLASSERATAVAAATGLPVGQDGETINLPMALDSAQSCGRAILA